jgi:hypothetical protein
MKRLLLVICVLSMGSLAQAQTAPSLGAAATFAVLGSSKVTCTAPGVISGDIGVSAGPFVNTTGCLVVGTVHQGDPAAVNAEAALKTAYANALVANSNCTSSLAAAYTNNVPALGPLPPGVYCNNLAAGLTFTTTTLTLDAGGNANAVWVFIISGAGGFTGTGFQVVMAGGGQPCNVYWLVGADSTLSASTFQGNILGGGAASAFTSTGGTLIGRILVNGAVTLTGPPTSVNVHGTCALVAQGGAGCKDDDDRDKDHHDRDRKDKDKDKDKDNNKDDNKDHN